MQTAARENLQVRHAFIFVMRSFKARHRCGPVVNLWFLLCVWNAVPARGRVARRRAHLKAQMKGAGLTPIVPKRASAMAPLHCVLPLSQRRTSPPAILTHKFASAGYVGALALLSRHCFILMVEMMVFFAAPTCISDQVCSGSICAKHNLEECTCGSKEGQDEAAELCHVCCMEKSEYSSKGYCYCAHPSWLSVYQRSSAPPQ